MDTLQRLCFTQGHVSPIQRLELFLAVFRRGFRMARAEMPQFDLVGKVPSSSSDAQRIPDSSVSEGAGVDTRGAVSGGSSAGAEVVHGEVEKEIVRLRSLLVSANGNVRDIDRQLIDQLVDVLLPALSTLLLQSASAHLQVWVFLTNIHTSSMYVHMYTCDTYIQCYIYLHVYICLCIYTSMYTYV
jgi:hypothetical protein